MIRLSACLMVKNEEALLPGCLESIKPLVDEIVVVDTGSTDSTAAIAESFGAAVRHHPWERSFSAHRNQSIGYATGDWLLIIDADERLIPTPGAAPLTAESLKEALGRVAPTINAAAVQLVDVQQGRPVMRTQAVRLFRRGQVRYKNRVHNAPVYEGSVEALSLATLEHHGYDLPPERMTAKFHRTRDLLLEQWEEEPDNPRVPFYLCQLYGMRGEDEECLCWGRVYLDMVGAADTSGECGGKGGECDLTALYTMAKTCQKLGRAEEALELILRGLRRSPNDPDLGLLLSDAGALARNPRTMADGARFYLDGLAALERDPAAFGGRFLFSVRDDVLAVQLFRLLSASLQEGLAAWEMLKARFDAAPPGVRTEARQLFERLGLAGLMDGVA